MNPELVLKALVEHHIDLAPVVDKTGIILWTAAVVKLAPDGWQNFVSERDFAQGDTPQDAVGALVARLVRQHATQVPVQALPEPKTPKPQAAPRKPARLKVLPPVAEPTPAARTPSRRRR